MKEKGDLERFCELAIQLGAADAKLIRADQVVVKNWVRWKCRFGCPDYGKVLMCPPYSPTPEETLALLKEYEYTLLFRSKPSTPKNLAVELEKRIFLEGYYAALAFANDSCHLCKECNVQKGYCIRPAEARPAMESCGISVFETAKNVGYRIEVLKSKEQDFMGYDLVLIC